MTTPLWTLLAFAAWTIAVLLFGVGTRRWYLVLSSQADLTSFPADVAHGSPAYRRAMRAHANCVENLPVYGAIILTAEAAHLTTPSMGTVGTIFILCRMMQSSIHMLLPETNVTIAARFTFFFVQIAAMIWMIVAIASSAAAA